MFIVYLLTSPSGKRYVGQTRYTLHRRWTQHVADARSGRKKNHFAKAILKYGPTAFDVQTWKSLLTKEEADVEERRLIQVFQTTNPKYGYNTTAGGEGVSMPRSSEHQAKIVKARSWYRPTPETIEKVAKAARGRKNPHPGHPWSEESKAKMRRKRTAAAVELSRQGHIGLKYRRRACTIKA